MRDVFGDAGDERRCKVCGCTQNNACMDDEKGACWWVDTDLCSHCEESFQAACGLELAELVTIAAQLLRMEKVEPTKAAYHAAARDSAMAALIHMRADLAGPPSIAITDCILNAYLLDIGLHTMVEEIVDGDDGQAEEEARQRLRRIERDVEWLMLPGMREGHEIMAAVVGTVQIFDTNPGAKYIHALGLRLGPRTGTIDEAQAAVIAEVVHGASTKRHMDFDDAVAKAKANGWVVYAHDRLEERAGNVLKAAGIKWLSISFSGTGYQTIALEGPVPDVLPEGILREKP